jgi:GT2 family glycosyltransferase
MAILNYHGRDHLASLLPTALEAAANSPVPCNLVVLDNSTDSQDADWLRANFPDVELVSAPQNAFLYSYNDFAQRRTEDILILLNNDLRLDAHFLAPLLAHFAARSLFSVSAKSFDWAGGTVTSGPACLQFAHGWYSWKFDTTRQELAHTLFTSGGFMAVDRLKFLELGGFHSLFYPGYCEDLDLCFRAWRRGWRCLYEPASVVWHRDHGTWSRNGNRARDALALRNAFLFQWSSLPMQRGRASRCWSTCKITGGDCLRGNLVFPKAWLAAAWRWLSFNNKTHRPKISFTELESLQRIMNQDVSRSTREW